MSHKNTLIPKPGTDEYPAYAELYMKWVSDDGKILDHLKTQIERTTKFFNRITKKQLQFVYAPGKWTIKETLVHIIDDERIYAYRALRIGRGDTTPLPGFSQDAYVPYSRANERSMEVLLKEYASVRKATLSLYKSFSEEDLLRKGIANNHTYSVRGLLYHLAGHELHHLHIIWDKYLSI